MSKRER